MSRTNPNNTQDINRKDSGGISPKSLKKRIWDVANFVIYDKNDVCINDDYDYDNGVEFEIDETSGHAPVVEFTKKQVIQEEIKSNVKINRNRIRRLKSIRITSPKEEGRKKYIKAVKRTNIKETEETELTLTQTFDSIKNEQNIKNSYSRRYRNIKIQPEQQEYIQTSRPPNTANISASLKYGKLDEDAAVMDALSSYNNPNNTSNSDISSIPGNSGNTSSSESAERAGRGRENDTGYTPVARNRRRLIRSKANMFNTIKRIIIVLFAIVAGSVTMPFGMNPMGVSLICAADKYILYIYSGLVVSLVATDENPVAFFFLYTIIAGIKFYLKYSRGKEKSQMLASSRSYRNLSGREKSKLMKLVHFNDTGSIITSLLISAVAGSAVAVVKVASKMPGVIYTDIVVVMLFILISMLFTYLYSGLFDIGLDNKMLEKSGICAVIFTIVYALAPIYIYTLSVGYIFSFVVTLVAASAGVNKKYTEVLKREAEENDEDLHTGEHTPEQSDEDIIRKFSLNSISQDGTLSDMTRGALIGFLCGIALGDTAGAVTLGVCGLVSGLFFAQSVTLAVIAGLISSISYSVYVAGTDAIQNYIPDMIIGLTFYLPTSMFYLKVFKNSIDEKTDAKQISLMDRGFMVTELPATKLTNLSDAFHNLSSVFFELSERLKNPSYTEIRAMVAATVERTCETCENQQFCELTDRINFNAVQKKCAEQIAKKNRLSKDGFPQIYLDNCIRLDDIKANVNALYIGRVDENIKNDKTKVFAAHYENIAKLLGNNSRTGKEDVAFKRDMSEKIFERLQNMGIDCENVIVIGERSKTVYIFGIKMVDYSGTISDITDMIEEICDIYADEPEYILEGNYVLMKVQSRHKFKLHSVQMSRAANELPPNPNERRYNTNTTEEDDSKKEVNGDSIAVFQSGDSYFYGMISDGMGSGKNAALSSRLTSLLMEKLLAAGNQKDLTLEMLNSLLLAKNDECFASVDLFEADLLTGNASFIKAGAAPSFVIRGGKLFKIQSSTVPAGIVSNMNSEQTKFELEDGDYVVMLSDGIISTFEEGAWLLEMLSFERNLREPKALAAEILRQAYDRNARKDDMSVLLMRVAEERG